MDDIVQKLKGDLARELAIIDFYQKHVEKVHDPVARKLFLQMISESMEHADQFRQMLYKRTMDIDLKQSGLSEVGLSNLLYFGMKEERETRLAYEKELPTIQDEEYNHLLTKIIEDEKRHEALLKEAYDRLKQ